MVALPVDGPSLDPLPVFQADPSSQTIQGRSAAAGGVSVGSLKLKAMSWVQAHPTGGRRIAHLRVPGKQSCHFQEDNYSQALGHASTLPPHSHPRTDPVTMLPPTDASSSLPAH